MNLSEIKTNPNNPRLIKDARFKQLKKSIEDLPHMMVLRPIVVDETGTVLGGNMRLEALKSLGYKEVPDEWVKRTDELSEEQKKEFVIKDNAGFGEWDWDQLANEWSEYPLADWGVDVPEDWAASPVVEEDESAVAEMIDKAAPVVEEDESAVAEMIDKAAELQEKWKVERGQIWEIGQHRLMCGDSGSPESYPDQRFDLTLSDPPYNVGVDYGNGKDADEKSDFTAWLLPIFDRCRSLSNAVMWTPGTVNTVEWIVMRPPRWICAWHKANQCSRSPLGFGAWEPVLFYADGKIGEYAHLGQDAWSIPIAQQKDAEGHPCPKLLQFWEQLIAKDVQSILEPFTGSGTTFVAGERKGCAVYGIEISPKYCAVTLERLSALGLTPKLTATEQQ